jgi:hypothetical protein
MPSSALLLRSQVDTSAEGLATPAPPSRTGAPRGPRSPGSGGVGDLLQPAAGIWRQRRGEQEASSPPSPPKSPPTLLVQADEDAVMATRDLEGRLGVFVRSVERLILGIGARVKLHLQGHSFACTVVSFTSHTDDVLVTGIYLTPDTEQDRREAALYFATRHAIFFEP